MKFLKKYPVFVLNSYFFRKIIKQKKKKLRRELYKDISWQFSGQIFIFQMPIVKSAHPSPIKINASLNNSEDLLSKPSEEIIDLLGLIVSNSFVDKARTPSKEIEDSLFYYKRGKPTISLNDYMKRIKHFTECSNEVLVLSLIYVERVLEKHQFNQEKMNFHK